MADSIPEPDEARPGPADPHSTVGAPRWVKILAGIGLIIVLLLIIMLLTGHGPGRHMQTGAANLSAEPTTASPTTVA